MRTAGLRTAPLTPSVEALPAPWIRFKRGRAAVPTGSVPKVSQGDLAFTQIMHLGEVYAVSRKARE